MNTTMANTRRRAKVRTSARILTVYNYGEETKILNFEKIPNVKLKTICNYGK